MKRKILGTLTVFWALSAVSVTASADYYLTMNKNGSDIRVQVVADNAELSAMEFTVKFPSSATIKNITTTSGAYYNEYNGIFAWASTDAPNDGAVMFSAEFMADNGDFTVTPAEVFSLVYP